MPGWRVLGTSERSYSSKVKPTWVSAVPSICSSSGMEPSGSKPWRGTTALARTFGWRASYQLDWWHLTQAFQRTFPDHPKLVHRLKQALYRGQGHRIIPAVRLAQLNGIGNPERVQSLLGYLETNQAGFYGARALRPHLSSQAKLVCVEGSGAVEKHMDLGICRRFPGLQGRQRPRDALDAGRFQPTVETTPQGVRQGRLAN